MHHKNRSFHDDLAEGFTIARASKKSTDMFGIVLFPNAATKSRIQIVRPHTLDPASMTRKS